MTVFKNSVVMSEQVIDLAVKLAKGESIGQAVTSRQNNGKFDVPSVLYAGQVIEKADIEPILVRSGFFKDSDLLKR
jgi:ABC-type xylose transport system substrate-binding protein